MKRATLLVLLLAMTAAGQATAPTPAELQKKVEAYVRKLFALGPSITVKPGNLTESPIPGFYQVNVDVTAGGQSDSASFYVSKDGRHLIRGELYDLAVDPFAANRARIKLDGAPSKGPTNARVVLVEYSDFQCPHCRQLYQILKELVPRYPQVRFVFKDFPLAQIHPWALTAAYAGRCASQQNPEAFWKLHDLVFDHQENITAENAWQTMLDYAGQLGLDTAAFRVCLTSEETKKAVEASVREGQALRIANTPTVFLNGRRIVGGDRQYLEQVLQYELSLLGPAPGTAPRPQP